MSPKIYHSKFEVERKIKQVKFALKELLKYENRVFVKLGIDEETGCNPFEVRLGTFLIFSRSIFQYVHKEVKGTNLQNEYEQYCKSDEIISFFKEVRDSEVHSLSIVPSIVISLHSPLYFGKRPENEPKETQAPKIEYKIQRRMNNDEALFNLLEEQGEMELVEAAKKGEIIFEELNFKSNTNIFDLCRQYMKSIETFIETGISKGWIT